MSRNRSHADWAMIFHQSFAATARRPGRSAATAVGIALGIAVFLVTVGWSQTVGSQINQTFDELAATKIVVNDTQGDIAGDQVFPTNTSQIVAQIPGVVAGGRLWGGGTSAIKTSAVAPEVDLPVTFVDPDTLQAAGATIASGRTFTNAESDQPVALLGKNAALALGITTLRPDLTVEITNQHTRALIIGILESAGSLSQLDHALIVAPNAPVALGTIASSPLPSDTSVIVRTELGVAVQVAKKLPMALLPNDPERLGVLLPPEPVALRGNVQNSLDTLAFGAASLSLLIGGIGIMYSMLNAVSQRSGEIGLRRSIGAARRHIVVQFLIEGALLGVIGAIIGVIAGELSLLLLAAVNSWNPVLDRRYLGFAPIVGLLIGVLAALYPALRAASINPAETLRS